MWIEKLPRSRAQRGESCIRLIKNFLFQRLASLATVTCKVDKRKLKSVCQNRITFYFCIYYCPKSMPIYFPGLSIWKVFSQSGFFPNEASFSFHMFVAITRAQIAGGSSPKVLALSHSFLAHMLPAAAFFLSAGVIWKDFEDLWILWWPGQCWGINDRDIPPET